MTQEPWPCGRCGHPGVRNLGIEGFCSAHLADLLHNFDPTVFQLHGIGLQAGPTRPDWGPTYADLECCACGATWTGPIGEACWWCARSREILADHQAELLLIPPDIEPGDVFYEQRMEAWCDRLVHGVRADLITRQQAESAWARAVRRADAP